MYRELRECVHRQQIHLFSKSFSKKRNEQKKTLTEKKFSSFKADKKNNRPNNRSDLNKFSLFMAQKKTEEEFKKSINVSKCNGEIKRKIWNVFPPQFNVHS